jgi:FkbM family methyltransferase
MNPLAKSLYRAIPFKRSVLHVLRDIKALPPFLRQRLYFDGWFEVQTDRGTFELHNGSGREIELALFWNGLMGFEPATMRCWLELSKTAGYVFDIGASTGVFSLAAKTMNRAAVVHAFEPIKRSHSILQRNFSRNGMTGAHQIALSDYCGTGDMYDLPFDLVYTASLNKNVHAERGQKVEAVTERVPVLTADSFMEQNGLPRLDLVKMDVESHEPSVLRGMAETIRKFHPTMIIEIWNNGVAQAVEQELDGCGYLYFPITNDGPPRSQAHITNDRPEIGYINYLVCKPPVAKALGLS